MCTPTLGVWQLAGCVSCEPLFVSVCRSCVPSSSVQRLPIPRWCPVRAWLFFTFLHTHTHGRRPLSVRHRDRVALSRLALLQAGRIPDICREFWFFSSLEREKRSCPTAALEHLKRRDFFLTWPCPRMCMRALGSESLCCHHTAQCNFGWPQPLLAAATYAPRDAARHEPRYRRPPADRCQR